LSATSFSGDIFFGRHLFRATSFSGDIFFGAFHPIDQRSIYWLALRSLCILEPTMQMIEAVIKPQRLDVVKNALAKLGVFGVTAIECKGFGRQMGHTERYRGARLDVGFVPKVMLKICVKDETVDTAVEAITTAARTGEVGDGKIFVYPIGRVVRIRTGETNDQAI
jgi:nitrogen regulatory protein P-II 2